MGTAIPSLPLLAASPLQPFAVSPRDPRTCPAVLASGAVQVSQSLPADCTRDLFPPVLASPQAQLGAEGPDTSAVPAVGQYLPAAAVTTATNSATPKSAAPKQSAEGSAQQTPAPAQSPIAEPSTPASHAVKSFKIAEDTSGLKDVDIQMSVTDAQPNGHSLSSLVPKSIESNSTWSDLGRQTQESLTHADVLHVTPAEHDPLPPSIKQQQCSNREATVGTGLNVVQPKSTYALLSSENNGQACNQKPYLQARPTTQCCGQDAFSTGTSMSRRQQIMLDTTVKQLQNELKV